MIGWIRGVNADAQAQALVATALSIKIARREAAPDDLVGERLLPAFFEALPYWRTSCAVQNCRTFRSGSCARSGSMAFVALNYSGGRGPVFFKSGACVCARRGAVSEEVMGSGCRQFLWLRRSDRCVSACGDGLAAIFSKPTMQRG